MQFLPSAKAKIEYKDVTHLKKMSRLGMSIADRSPEVDDELKFSLCEIDTIEDKMSLLFICQTLSILRERF